MMRRILVVAAAMAAFSGVAGAAGSDETTAEARMERAIDRALHADGPFLNAEERALVERKCGYAAGSWDGNNFSMNNGVLHCTNGRKADDAEVRAMMAVAGQRIERRVKKAMAQPEVVAAIDAVAREATAEALRELAAGKRD